MTKSKNASIKLRCINIVSANPKRLADFYQTALGANIDESHGGPHRIEIWFGNNKEDSFVIVANYDETFTPKVYNTCQGFELQVANVNKEYQRIKALGIEIKEPPQNLPWGYCFFHCTDPDGNGIDIVQSL